MTNVTSEAHTPAQSTPEDSLSSENSLHTWSGIVLTGNCCCQMLLHYLKVPSVSQYWLLNTAASHSLTAELCKEQYYALFNNLNSLCHKVLLQKVLERKYPSGTTPWNNHLARLCSSFNTIEIFLPGTEHSWANKWSNQGLQRGRR